MNRSSADVEGNTPRDIEARVALDSSLARQRATAEGKRAVNTQGVDSIARADSLQSSDDWEEQGWMA